LVCHTKEEHRLRVFENRVLRRMSGHKREEVVGGWKSLLNEELHNVCTSPNIIRVIKLRGMRWVGHVVCMGEMSNAYQILVRKSEGKRPLRRPRHRWEGNIRMDLREIGWEGVDWIHMVQDRDQLQAHVDMVMNLWVPQKVGGFCVKLSDSQFLKRDSATWR
jgi:hypothetical protein